MARQDWGELSGNANGVGVAGVTRGASLAIAGPDGGRYSFLMRAWTSGPHVVVLPDSTPRPYIPPSYPLYAPYYAPYYTPYYVPFYTPHSHLQHHAPPVHMPRPRGR